VLLPWNDLDLLKKTLEKRHEEIAAVITEPVMCNNGCIQPRAGYLEGLRELCTRFGIVLIFDEVITGFRMSLGGAQRKFGITPDLGIFGKALASGFPISVVAGRECFMRPLSEGSVIHAGTMNSGQASIAAALATLDVLKSENVHERLYTLGRAVMDGLREAARKAKQPLLVQGPGPMFHAGFTPLKEVAEFRDCLSYDKAKYAAFVRGMQEQGVRLIGRGLWYISAAHTESDVRRCIQAASEVLERLNP
jgi:glutamate-1-semialdehyde 2,1-aminomutase